MTKINDRQKFGEISDARDMKGWASREFQQMIAWV